MSHVAEIPDYGAAFERYLATSDERDLACAYEIGRLGLGDGTGVLDLVALHHAALRRLNGGGTATTLDRAGEFLAEALSPFEMAQRGYLDAIERLNETNQVLQKRNAELVEAQAAAEVAMGELESFSSSVAHDLRAPLRGIEGFAQILREDYAGALDEEAASHLLRIQNLARHMSQLIDDLLELSHVARSDLTRQSVDVTTLARTICANLRRDTPERRVEVAVQEGLVVEADARLLGVVLDNLLGNAWKFTSKRNVAHIELGALPGQRPAVYFVRDDGAGFDMAYAGKLFGVFQRLHTVEEFPGTGIGLALAKRVVRRHGGRIWAEGRVDHGATVYFTLESDGPPRS